MLRVGYATLHTRQIHLGISLDVCLPTPSTSSCFILIDTYLDYIGGCTDPSLNDPSCNRACEDLSVADITFDVNANTWTCCGADADGNVTCNEPTAVTVVAKPIVRLATTYVVPSILVTASATGTRPDFANTGSPSIDTSKPESKDSSSGTSLAGPIASGVIGGVALIAIVLGVIFWYRQRRRRSPPQNLPSGAPSGHELPDQGRYYALDKSRQGRTELESVTPHAIEMDGTSRHDRRSIQELP